MTRRRKIVLAMVTITVATPIMLLCAIAIVSSKYARVQEGMNYAEVIELIGPEDEVRPITGTRVWYTIDGFFVVTFTYSNQVQLKQYVRMPHLELWNTRWRRALGL